MTQQEIEFVRWCVANDIHRFYVWGKWKQVRQQVLDMDHNECQRCREQHKYTAATTVHHVNYVKAASGDGSGHLVRMAWSP